MTLMDRKTKRHSPPPLDKLTNKWSRVLHLISPPNKKRRSIAIIQSSSDDDYMHALKRELCMDRLNKQKTLNRRAMYIPSPPDDGPKDAAHQWSLYRSTYQKLRQNNTLPLSEIIHLRKMLVLLQPKKKVVDPVMDDEDDVPLGTLLEKNKSTSLAQPRYLTASPTTSFYLFSPYYQPPYYYYNTAQYI